MTAEFPYVSRQDPRRLLADCTGERNGDAIENQPAGLIHHGRWKVVEADTDD